MSTSKHIDKICCMAFAFSLIITFLLFQAEQLGIQAVSAVPGYESRLFDTSSVHTIDIVMDDWDSFIENCTDEKYADCTVIIDGDACKNVAIRAKGNTSLTSVANYGNNRYSFKIEFDHYDNSNTYYGLDKLCLNNIIQDNTYMKDYLTYELMRAFDVNAPLCSYAYITVNGQDWGLYLAVEAVEEAFLQRNYGSDYGELYKPDSMTMGGGRGNGKDFIPDMPRRFDENTPDDQPPQKPEEFGSLNDQMPDKSQKRPPDEPGGILPDTFDGQMHNSENDPRGGPKNEPAGSSDVSLIYTDDEYDSYSNIFENAKTNITDHDKDRLIASLRKLNEKEDISNIIDVDTVIRYFVVHNFVLNFDSYTGTMVHNYYLYEKDGQLSMIPWDYNLAFGGFMSELDTTALINYPIDTPVSGGSIDSKPMLAWIFDSDEYTELYHRYFSEFISDCFDSGFFINEIDSLSEMLSPYVERDRTKFCTYEEFQEGVSTLREFCLLRAESINSQLNGIIPRTSEEQSKNKDSFVDGSHLTISSMGTMEDRAAPAMP